MEAWCTGDREMLGGIQSFRIDVRIHLRDPEMAQAMQWCLRSGTATDGDTVPSHTSTLRTRPTLCSTSLSRSKAGTQQSWEVADDMETEVEDEDGEEGDA
jgi:hypothetical protein